jgi:hypothetical protein
MIEDLEGLAQRVMNQIFANIGGDIWETWAHHRIRHEPGGDDPIALDLDELANCHMTGKADGDVPVWNAASGRWEPGAGGGGPGGGGHSAHFSLPLPALVVPPGPKNLSGATWTISKVNAVSDGSVSFSATGVSAQTYGDVGDDQDFTPGSATVADGARLSVTVTDVGTANYLALTWFFE